MIAIDTSALMAILLREPLGPDCRAVITREPNLVMSAGTLAEALIVAERRSIGTEMASLIEGFGITVVEVTPAAARRAAAAYRRWGKGLHAAALNYGDCFAYEVARTHACPLLYVGRDFALTDIASAL